jgi:hypothetical protein
MRPAVLRWRLPIGHLSVPLDREGRRVRSGTTMKDSIQVDSQQRSIYGAALDD